MFQSCAIESSAENLHINLEIEQTTISVFTSDTATNHSPLQKCGSATTPKLLFKNGFYLSMLAVSADDSQYRVDVENMMFESDVENVTLIEFQKVMDSTLPRLFKNINMLAANKNKQPVAKRSPDTAVNITQIFQNQ